MRELLYRGKRVDNGEWVYGDLIKDCLSGQYFIHPYGDSANESDKVGQEGCLMLYTFEVEPETISEYTGLTDKNGKNIFEDDIVSIVELSAVKVCGCYVVKYNTKQARYGLFTADGAEQAGFNFDTMKSYNIIGNIYDNPELLTEKE